MKAWIAAFLITILSLGTSYATVGTGHGGRYSPHPGHGSGEAVVIIPPVTTAGANLPITTPVNTWGGTKRYIGPSGSGSTCSDVTPCTWATAYAASSSGDTIIVHGGTYADNFGSQWNGTSWTTEPTVAKTNLTVAAYPNETPVFDGARILGGIGTAEGSWRYFPYTPRPCTTGFGITFCSGMNINGGATGVGRLPDQAWMDGVQIQQVTTKAAVTGSNLYFVDSATNRIYFWGAQVTGATEIAVSDLGDWMTCQVSGLTLSGLKVIRYSNTASHAAVFDMQQGCDNLTALNIEIDDTAMLAIGAFGVTASPSTDDRVVGATFTSITLNHSGWMGMNFSYAKDVSVDYALIENGDQWDEFASSPQSGAIKTSRVYNITVNHSEIINSRSQGIWFDQSNYNMIVANSVIDNNGVSTSDSGLFCEISDTFLAANNFIRGPIKNPLKIVCTGARLWNNTFIGGLGNDIVADPRLQPGCATSTSVPGAPQCNTSSSLFSLATSPNPARPATLDWSLRLDDASNNAFLAPTVSGYCGATAALCIAASNSNNNQTPINVIIHHADGARGIPATTMDCNVYANGNGGKVVGTQSTDYASASAWSTYAAGAPISISGLDANSLTDPTGTTYFDANGVATGALTHANACNIPADVAALMGQATNYHHYGTNLR